MNLNVREKLFCAYLLELLDDLDVTGASDAVVGEVDRLVQQIWVDLHKAAEYFDQEPPAVGH